MNSVPEKIWKDTTELLRVEMIDINYTTWIDTLILIGIEGDTIILEAPNQFNIDMLNKRYKKIIESAIFRSTEKNYGVKFINGEDSNQRTKLMEQMKKELNPKYTFDSFVIGKSNNFAQAACVSVAGAPGTDYNPLFIYGDSGLGKTHLMQAIGNHILEENQNSKVVYASCEQFMNEMINAIATNKNQEFRDKYRTVDLLLLDDIQFLSGKDSTQEEFFHTFNALYPDKQIVITSDKPPKELKGLEDRLISRFEGGLICDIKYPDLETRIAILRKKATSENLEVSSDVIEYIADNIHSNIRELEGALLRVIAYASLTNTPVNVELAEATLKDLYHNKKNIVIDTNRIKTIVSENYSISIEDIDSRKRPKDIAFARQVAMYLTRELTDLSLPKIGNEFGGRDHTTVIHACDKINNEIKIDLEFKNHIDRLIKNVKGE
ncbi:MAG: chromosomal replication initiator protein DnaA [Tissierellia bacterium]|nr:chromosomal replication initiator protein DnaA [Tissierellia bacterium]